MARCKGKTCGSSPAFRRTLLNGYGGVSYSAEALALFAQWDALGTSATDARKTLVNNTIVALKSANIWSSLDFLYVWTAHSQSASLVDWKNPSTRTATANGNLTFTTDSYWQGGTTGRMALGYNPGDGGTYNFTQNDNSFGVYFKDHTNETKVNISSQSAGSVGVDLQSVITTFGLTTKNNSGTPRGVANFTNKGLASCERTASNSWQNRKNGYDLYNNSGYETDASNAVLNLEWMGFCRNINSAYTVFSTAKQCFAFSGARVSTFNLSYLIEKNFLNPLSLVPTKRVTFNGNSYTSTGTYLKRVLVDHTNYNDLEIQSRGISGQTTPEMTTDATTTVFPMIKTFLTKNIHFVWELTNDMVATSSNATTCYNNLVAHCQALRASQSDAIIIVATCLPRTTITEVNRITLNGLVNGNADGAWNYISDVASDPNMGQAGQNTDLTYYDADTIHPNTTGYNLLADTYIYPSILAVL